MSPPPRSLTFVVSTSLLTASLSLAGCDDPKGAVDDGPQKADKGGDADNVNVGPETPPQPEPPPQPETPPQPEPPPPEDIHVNEGPEPVPEPPPVIKSNPGPEGEKLPEPVEPKRVNTRPEP